MNARPDPMVPRVKMNAAQWEHCRRKASTWGRCSVCLDMVDVERAVLWGEPVECCERTPRLLSTAEWVRMRCGLTG